MTKDIKMPMYKSMYRDIKEKIEKERYPVGTFLPCEEELQREYSVSRTTVRRAVALLQEEGYVSVRQGCGTEVVRNKVYQSLNDITSVSESLRQTGHEVGVACMSIERIPASHVMAQKLNIAVGESVVLISRIQTCDGKPITIAKNYIPERLVPGIADEKEGIISLYQYLQERYSLHITKVSDRISAFSATFDEAAALGIEPKSALIVVNRVCYALGAPCEIDCVKIIASQYEYQNDFEKEVH